MPRGVALPRIFQAAEQKPRTQHHHNQSSRRRTPDPLLRIVAPPAYSTEAHSIRPINSGAFFARLAGLR